MATPSFRIKLRLPPKDEGMEVGSPSNPASVAGDAQSDEGSTSGSDGGNEDELDELLEEVDEQELASNMSNTPVRKKSTLKSQATDTPSPGGSPATKKRPISTREETRGMSLAELDALPAAKRRRAHQARGASGPGRGWRKGLKMGQKPKYEVPPEPEKPDIPEKPQKAQKADKGERTPGTKGSASKAKGSAAKPTPAKGATAVQKGPPFKYHPVAPWRTVPPIKPLNRIPQIIPTIAPLDRTGEAAKKAPRRWTHRRREIMSLGGRPWSVPSWFGGPDLGYVPGAAAAGDKTSGATLAGAAATADGRSTPGGTPAPSTPSGGHGTRPFLFGGGGAGDVYTPELKDGKVAAAAPGLAGVGASAGKSKARSRSSLGGSRVKGTASGSGSGSAGASLMQRSGSASAKSSPLTPSVPLPAAATTQPVGDWRGSSPAFFAGARKTG